MNVRLLLSALLIFLSILASGKADRHCEALRTQDLKQSASANHAHHHSKDQSPCKESSGHSSCPVHRHSCCHSPLIGSSFLVKLSLPVSADVSYLIILDQALPFPILEGPFQPPKSQA